MSELSSQIAKLSPEQRAVLERRLRERRSGRTATDVIPRRDPGLAGPLSFSQQRLWFLERLQPDSSAYNLFGAFVLEGRLDVHALQRSLLEVLRRHVSLRTRFVETDGEPAQAAVPVDAFELPVHDLSGLGAAEREAEARRRATLEAQRPFDLSRGLLLRASLLRLREQEHVLLLVVHHIAADGWSIGILIHELGALYEAFRLGRPSPLAEPTLQYADFAAWQRGRLQGETLEASLAYWRRQLEDLTPLELPMAKPRPRQRSFEGAALSMALAPELSRRLKDLAEREGATPFMLLLAGFQALLRRYTRQDDVAVGSPAASRGRSEVEGLIGFFVNTLVLRTDLGGNPTFRELLRRVRETTLEAAAHQDLPFEKIVEELQPDRDPARNPLVQVLFAFQNAPREAFRLPGLAIRRLDALVTRTRFDLELYWGEQRDHLVCGACYGTELLDADSVQRLLGHYHRLLQGVAAEPDRRLSDLPLLAAAERARILVAFNETARPSPRARSVAELFDAQAARTPQAAAVVLGDESLSYLELQTRADGLARRLRARGVGPDVRVGVCLERSLDMAIAVLGVLKAGGAYVPLDPAYPGERLKLMLEDAAAPVLLTQPDLAAGLPADGRDVLFPADTAPDESKRDETAPAAVHAENLAYVIYTSGSTGIPKGVAMTQGALVNLVDWQLRAAASPAARTLQYASLSFDVSFQEMFSTWCAGGTLVLAPEPVRRDPAELWRLLREQRVERLFLPFVALQQLAEAADVEAGDAPPLAEIVTAGEQLQVTAAVARLFGRLPGCRLANHYGPSESHVVTALDLNGSPERWGTLPPIGRAIDNARMYVFDDSMEPTPIGVPGELYIGGDCLARGYLDRPDATAERFLPDPFAGAPGRRLYRTGDLGRFLPDGTLEFLGRMDHQVKVRGYRIEPGEVEAVLGRHPGVKETAVVVREGPGGSKRLVACVVGRGEPAPAAAELREFLEARLPEFMVPSAYATLAALPLTPSGKVNRRALAAAADLATELPSSRVPPRGPLEEALAGIWADVLGIETVGAFDDFFERGGHSLLATRVASRVRQLFGVEMPLRTLFEARTVAGLSERIEALRRGPAAEAQPLEPASRVRPLPASFAQQRLWVLQRLDPGSAAYHLASAVRLTGPLDRDALGRAVDEVVRRHEALRTVFEMAADGLVQVVVPAPLRTLAVVDLTGARGDEDAELRRLCEEQASRPFDLSRGPLLRATLVRLEEDEHVLAVAMHHIASDGWSLGVLFRELSSLYDAFSAGRGSPLPPLPVQYGDFAVWQRKRLDGDAFERQLSYWRDRLSGLEPLELPTDRRRPAVQTFRGGRETVALDADAAASLRSLCRRAGATPFMVLLSAFQVLLGRHAGRDDVAVGTPVAGRSHRGLEGLIGFFVNTLVLRSDLSSDPTFAQLVRRMKETCLQAFDHQEVPFERLVQDLNPARDVGRGPLAQVMFAVQNAPFEPLRLDRLRVEPLATGREATRFEMELHWWEHEGRFFATLVYNRDLWEPATVSRILGRYLTFLRAALESPERRLSRIPLLDAEERRQAIALGVPSPRIDPCPLSHRETDRGEGVGRETGEPTILEAFADQAARRPQALAVEGPDARLTYGELDRDANRLARRLKQLGVAREAVVAVCLERSPRLVAAVLAVLKAGGAYLPLDPAHPASRLALMVRDAGSSALVTDAAGAERLRAGGVPTLRVDDPTLGAESDGPLPYPTDDASLAYVIYTSGSTGRPKGVAVEQRGLANLVAWHRRAYAVGEDDRATLVASPGFDASVWEIWPYLAAGASLHVPDEATRLSPRALLEWLGEREITLSFLPTPLAEAVLKEEARRPLALRALLTGGDRLHRPERVPAFRLVNHYGPTENSVVATCADVDAASDAPPPIGRPIDDTRAYVLDGAFEPVPSGSPGELFIGGRSLARGYLGRPELTAELFVPDPHGAEPGARLYRTGDRVRFLADGTIEFLGRSDQQVKVRGFRIELAEVETALARQPGVREAAVAAFTDAGGETRLAAYVVPNDAPAPAAEELLRALERELPAPMVPSACLVLEAMPLLASGKVDRRALPRPPAGPVAGAIVPPRDDVETAVARVWGEVLGIASVGVTQNFFDLGGHSLRLVQVHERLLAAFPESGLSVLDLFRHTTVASLAERLRQGAASSATDALDGRLGTLHEGRQRIGRRRARVSEPEP